MPPGLGYINPAIIAQAFRQRGLLPQGSPAAQLPPWIQPTGPRGMNTIAPQNVTSGLGQVQIQQKPGGLSGFLARPGIADALLATGSALLAQADQPGSLGGALGRALPMGVQALRAGQQEAALDEAFADAPESMKRLLRGLNPGQRQAVAGNILMQRLMPKEPQVELRELANGQIGRFVDGELVAEMGPEETVEPARLEFREVGGRLAALDPYTGAEVTSYDIPQGREEVAQATTDLRKEFNALPTVNVWRQVNPAYESAKQSLTQDTPAADLDIIYAVAKAVDPDSVVREGEAMTVTNAASPANRYLGLWNYIQGGGRLTQAQRQELMGLVENRMAGHRKNYNDALQTYTRIADFQELDHSLIFIGGTEPAGGGAFDDLIPR